MSIPMWIWGPPMMIGFLLMVAGGMYLLFLIMDKIADRALRSLGLYRECWYFVLLKIGPKGADLRRLVATCDAARDRAADLETRLGAAQALVKLLKHTLYRVYIEAELEDPADPLALARVQDTMREVARKQLIQFNEYLHLSVEGDFPDEDAGPADLEDDALGSDRRPKA